MLHWTYLHQKVNCCLSEIQIYLSILYFLLAKSSNPTPREYLVMSVDISGCEAKNTLTCKD